MAKSFEEFLERHTTPEMRARVDKRVHELQSEMLLVELRKLTGQSQVDLAAKLGIKQPSLSKLERQSDMHISTLSNVIRALGGELDLVARFPDITVKLKSIDPDALAAKRVRAGVERKSAVKKATTKKPARGTSVTRNSSAKRRGA